MLSIGASKTLPAPPDARPAAPPGVPPPTPPCPRSTEASPDPRPALPALPSIEPSIVCAGPRLDGDELAALAAEGGSGSGGCGSGTGASGNGGALVAAGISTDSVGDAGSACVGAGGVGSSEVCDVAPAERSSRSAR